MATTSITKKAHDKSVMPEAIAFALGPLPFSSTEEQGDYELAEQMIAQDLRPQGFLGWKYIRDLAFQCVIIRRLRKVQFQITEALLKATIVPQATRLPSGEVVTPSPTLAACFGPYEQLDKMLAVAERRYENTLKQFEELGELGERLRKAFDGVIEGECRPLEEAAA